MSSRTGRLRDFQASSTPLSGRLVVNSSRPVDIGPSCSFDPGDEGLLLTMGSPKKAADAGSTARRNPRRRLPTSKTASCTLSLCAGQSSTASSGGFRSGALWSSARAVGAHPMPIPSGCGCRRYMTSTRSPATRGRLPASSRPTAYRSSLLTAGLAKTLRLCSRPELPLSDGRLPCKSAEADARTRTEDLFITSSSQCPDRSPPNVSLRRA